MEVKILVLLVGATVVALALFSEAKSVATDVKPVLPESEYPAHSTNSTKPGNLGILVDVFSSARLPRNNFDQ